jgi:hypothetical protein
MCLFLLKIKKKNTCQKKNLKYPKHLTNKKMKTYKINKRWVVQPHPKFLATLKSQGACKAYTNSVLGWPSQLQVCLRGGQVTLKLHGRGRFTSM